MDSLITAAARALSRGDVLGALNSVSLRDDPPALALRGIAMAQLGDYPRARELLRRAARAFGAHEELHRARCVVAEAEVALAMRDLTGWQHKLAAASAALDAHGDSANAVHAHLITVRRLLLLGQLEDAGAALALLEANRLPPPLSAVAALLGAELALRSLDTVRAKTSLAHARQAAERACIPALLAEVAEAEAVLDRPAARCMRGGQVHSLRLAEVERLFASDTLVVDACRNRLRLGARSLSLLRRPVLFALARVLAEAWPADVERHELIARVFRTRSIDESHRVRLRVEIGRLRALAKPFAAITASQNGFTLTPHHGTEVVVLLPPIEGDQAMLLALLADGTPWSTSALALALGASQRTVQRALVELESTGKVRSVGRARAQRWLSAPLVGFTTNLLLPATLPLR